MKNKFFAALLFGLAVSLTGFSGAATAQADKYVHDPLETFNRAIYRFNVEVDNLVLKPVTNAYTRIFPEPARNCVSNVFGNISDIGTSLNNALQGKLGAAFSDLCRVAINSTVGIFGCFDVASEMGLEKHREDFGQTLGRWGVEAGPYVMLPFLGPSSLRDAIGLFAVDSQIDLVGNLDHIRTRNQLMGLRIVDQRAALMYASSIIDNAALDPYVFVRDAYFQRRNSQVYDGDPPDEDAAPATQPVTQNAPAAANISFLNAPPEQILP